jgi:D-lactate dehydrogenase
VNQMAPLGVDRSAAAAGVAARLKGIIRPDRIMTDPLMTYAYSGDASSYRLVPAVVVIVNTEDEVRAVIEAARAERLPLTFRAAGTSLSGQAITEGVLAVLGDGWKKLRIFDNGERVTLGPAIIVANANKALKPFNKKLGPDPASQATCKIGGVVNNNSSGMCCGVAYNTYHTMVRLRVMLTDGTVLDSGDPDSVAAFRASHAGLLQQLHELHHEVTADPELVELIRRKYRIKNTVGYSVNALVDFHDPIDILIHLIVGSEGTLGFVSEVTYRTIDEHPHKATDLVVFPDPHSCARAISKLANDGVQTTTGVTAAEYIERRALATVEHLPAIVPYVPYFTETSPAVLIDVSAPTEARARRGDRQGCRDPSQRGRDAYRLLDRRGEVPRAVGRAQGLLRLGRRHATAREPRCSPRTWRRRSTGSPTSSSTCASCLTITATRTPSSSGTRSPGTSTSR